jgi:DNA invertase Pin-like site-specific DNA recombinase
MNAVIYARYSSVGQNEQSIDGQIRICKEYAESKGFVVVKVYIDKAKSAWSEGDKRVDFQKMLNNAPSGAFENIIVYKFDRFARNRLDSMVHKQRLKREYGIRVISATEPVSDDEGGEIYEMFLEWNDEKYGQRLSKRVRDGLTTSVANGTFCGGSINYGYKIRKEQVGTKDRYIKYVDIDKQQADIVPYIFDEYVIC